jgi:hypothetical protein
MIDPEYFAHKRTELGMDRMDILVQIQSTLDVWYPQQTRVQRLHRGVLRIVTPNASVASDLRLRQLELINLHSDKTATHEIERLQISIASLR